LEGGHGLGLRGDLNQPPGRRLLNRQILRFEPIGKDAAAFQEFFRGDLNKWTEFAKERGLKGAQQRAA
jgi:hypothetical protein